MSNDNSKIKSPFPELLFMVTCTHAACSAQEKKLIIRILNHPTFDPHLMLTLAFHHGVVPLVHRTLKQLKEEELLPADPTIERMTKMLEKHYISIVRKNMLMSAELVKLMRFFDSFNIEALAFKGPALAQIAYGDISMRQFGDLDIFIKRQDFRTVAAEMQKRGYTPLYPIEEYTGDKVLFELNNDCPFYDKRSLAVEIHWDFFKKLSLPTAKLHPWEHTRTVTLNRHSVTTLSNETHLLYHALHGSKHLWERFIWIVDIDRFIRNVPEIDWNKVLRMSEALGARKMFLLGPALATHYLGTPLPKQIQHLCQEADLEAFISFVDSELHSRTPTPEESLVKWKKVIALRDTLYFKTTTVLEFLLRPGINERRMIILPDKWFWLYWFLRPIGMVYRFIRCRILKLCQSQSDHETA